MSMQRAQDHIDDWAFAGGPSEQPWSSQPVALSASEAQSQGTDIEVGLHASQGNMPQDHEGRDSIMTMSVSSVSSKDQNNFTQHVMVEVGQLHEWLCEALMDTGTMLSFVCYRIVCWAMEWGLTEIQPYRGECPVGIEQKGKVNVLGRCRLKFFISDRPYTHSFLVIEDDDRYDMLLGGKFLERTRLVQRITTD